MRLTIHRIRVVTVLFSCCSLLLSCGGGGSSTPPALAYYIDSISGSNSNSGLDASHPWQSLDKLNSAPVSAGASIYLKRGSVWYEQLTVPASAITIDAYGSGALPVIDGSRVVGAWTDEGGGIYSAAVSLNGGEGLGNLSEDGVMMPFVAWNTNAATTFAGAPNGTCSYLYPGTLFIKRATAPTGAYRASVKFFGVIATSLNDVIVKNTEIKRFSLHGINFKDCVRCEVHGAVVSQGGGATIAASLYAGNGIEFGNNSANGVVDGATLSEIFDSCISPQTYESNRTMSSITIKNSTLDKCGFAGVEVSVLSNGGTTGSSITGVTLSGLTVTNAGKGWSGQRYGTEGGHGIRIITDAGAGTMSGVQVDTTTIAGSAGDGIRLAGNIGTVNLNRMNVRNNFDGISLREVAGAATNVKLHLTSSLVHHNADFGIHYNSPTAEGFELYQNTFSGNGSVNIFVSFQRGVAKLRNNIFYGSLSSAHIYAAGFTGDVVMDNNCYNEFTYMFTYNGTTQNTVADFRAANPSFESGGAGGAVDLTDPAGNFTLMNSSVCKTLGSAAVGVTTDYSGYPYSNPPSSGAYQFR